MYSRLLVESVPGIVLQESTGHGHVLVAAVLAIVLAAVHLWGGRLPFHEVIPRSRLLSLGSGVSVAYVFVHLLPELASTNEVVDERVVLLRVLEQYVFLVALLGFVTFYGIERFVVRSKADGDDETPIGVFWIHVGVFAVYNALIGYLLFHREEPGLWNLGLFAGAMALHFVVNDFGFRHHHREIYRRTGRWLLAAAILAGATVGALTTVDPVVLGVLFGFLAGGVVLNVIKEELPEHRQSRFWAFAIGSIGYAAMLVLI